MTWKWLTSVRLGGSALVDILVALSMCWCLYHKKTGFARWVIVLLPPQQNWLQHPCIVLTLSSWPWWYSASAVVCWRGENTYYMSSATSTNECSVVTTTALISVRDSFFDLISQYFLISWSVYSRTHFFNFPIVLWAVEHTYVRTDIKCNNDALTFL